MQYMLRWPAMNEESCQGIYLPLFAPKATQAAQRSSAQYTHPRPF